MDIKQLASDVVEFDWMWKDEAVHITYDFSSYTPELEARISAKAVGTFQAESLVEFLTGLLIDWDLVSNGEPYPPTADNLRALPVVFLADALNAIADDATKDVGTEGKSVAAGSPQAAQ